MKKYPLTFAEAMEKMLDGYVVANNLCSNIRYRAKDARSSFPEFQQRHTRDSGGLFCHWGERPFGVIIGEVLASWRVVPTKGYPNV